MKHKEQEYKLLRENLFTALCKLDFYDLTLLSDIVDRELNRRQQNREFEKYWENTITDIITIIAKLLEPHNP